MGSARDLNTTADGCEVNQSTRSMVSCVTSIAEDEEAGGAQLTWRRQLEEFEGLEGLEEQGLTQREEGERESKTGCVAGRTEDHVRVAGVYNMERTRTEEGKGQGEEGNEQGFRHVTSTPEQIGRDMGRGREEGVDVDPEECVEVSAMVKVVETLKVLSRLLVEGAVTRDEYDLIKRDLVEEALEVARDSGRGEVAPRVERDEAILKRMEHLQGCVDNVLWTLSYMQRKPGWGGSIESNGNAAKNKIRLSTQGLTPRQSESPTWSTELTQNTEARERQRQNGIETALEPEDIELALMGHGAQERSRDRANTNGIGRETRAFARAGFAWKTGTRRNQRLLQVGLNLFRLEAEGLACLSLCLLNILFLARGLSRVRVHSLSFSCNAVQSSWRFQQARGVKICQKLLRMGAHW